MLKFHLGLAKPSWNFNTVYRIEFFTCHFFFYQGFLSQTLTIDRTAAEGRGASFISLYHFHPLTNIEIFFATLHVRWLSRIFNRNPCAFQTTIDEIYNLIELPFDWLINDAIFVCLLDELILALCYSDFEMGNRWIWTRIDYHPFITSEPTNQVC